MKNIDSLLKNYKPSEQELKRIEFLDIVMKDKNTIDVSTATQLFVESISAVFEKTNIGKEITNIMTEKQYVKLLNGLCLTFMSSIYCSASKDENQLKTRMKLVEIINKDIIVGVEIKESKNG